MFIGIAAGLLILIVSVFVIGRLDKKDRIINEGTYIAQNNTEKEVLPVLPLDTVNLDANKLSNEAEKVDFKANESILSDKNINLNKGDSSGSFSNTNLKPSKPNTRNSASTKKKEKLDPFLAMNEERVLDETDDDYSDIRKDVVAEEDDFGSGSLKEEESNKNLFQKERIQSQNKAATGSDLTKPQKLFERKPDLDSEYKSLPGAVDTIFVGDEDESIPPVISRADSLYIDYYGDPGKVGEYLNVSGKKLKAQAITQLLFEGVDALRNNDYSAARNKFKEVILSSPHNVTAFFYLGETELMAGNFKEAVRYFRHNLDYPAAPVYDENKWLLARAYLGAEKNKPAKRLLEEIVGSESRFRDQALRQLEDLQ
ncbi:MAG: tetratricopeptide repeat protein [Bacteroidia bacterium]|nr:tetratricopeptide repeat protein [Bacteroidia bacterium]